MRAVLVRAHGPYDSPRVEEIPDLVPREGEVIVDGRCTTMTGLSDFVANLEGSGFFKRGVEIIQSQTETGPATVGELIRFSIKATFQLPGSDASKTVAGAKPAPPAAAKAAG
jgi:hypothetical protein